MALHPNYMKTYKAFQKLLCGNTQTDRLVTLQAYFHSCGIFFRVLKQMSTDVSDVGAASIIRAMSVTHSPDDGGSMHLWNVVDICLTTRQNIPEVSEWNDPCLHTESYETHKY
jgi:hypothetical protein